MIDFFLEGGPFMLVTLVFGVVALVTSVRGALSPGPDRTPRLATWCLLTVTSGGLGTIIGLEVVVRAVPKFDPSEHFLLFVHGLAEALQNLVLALGFVLASLLALAVAQWRQARQLRAAAA